MLVWSVDGTAHRASHLERPGRPGVHVPRHHPSVLADRWVGQREGDHACKPACVCACVAGALVGRLGCGVVCACHGGGASDEGEGAGRARTRAPAVRHIVRALLSLAPKAPPTTRPPRAMAITWGTPHMRNGTRSLPGTSALDDVAWRTAAPTTMVRSPRLRSIPATRARLPPSQIPLSDCKQTTANPQALTTHGVFMLNSLRESPLKYCVPPPRAVHGMPPQRDASAEQAGATRTCGHSP